MSDHENTHPKLHNAMWPGLVGKGPDADEPFIELDTLLELTAAARAGGHRFDGVDLFVAAPHVDIDIDDDGLRRLADRIGGLGLVVGSLVAPVWPPTGGGSAMGDAEERGRFVEQVRKTCAVGAKLREMGIRPYGVVRIDSACGPGEWAEDPDGNQATIAATFREACDVASDHGERLAAEGEVCWGGMHSWRTMVDLLERVDRPGTIGFQADMAHTLLYTLGVNAPEDRILPADFGWDDPEVLDAAIGRVAAALRPWTIDVHIAQNDATVKGSGSHDKTGRHCTVDDPAGKLDVTKHARHWLRDEHGDPNPSLQHVCWDGCMFANSVMTAPETWNAILAAMVQVREAHGWPAATAARR
ncbi:MAG: sugar phosphate isomerase/epimerase family protein [Planctomycetota bacterium]|jgi:sugar phosphate isomerase/epimerase